MSDEYRESHIREMEAITETDENQSDDMVANKLIIILPRFFEFENDDDSLLGPVRGLEEVVEFELPRHGFMREAFIHPVDVEIPYWCAGHDE